MVGTGTNLMRERCSNCSGVGRVEAKPRHTSLRLACCCNRPNECHSGIRLAENVNRGLQVDIRHESMVLDAESEERLRTWLNARHNERQSP